MRVRTGGQWREPRVCDGSATHRRRGAGRSILLRPRTCSAISRRARPAPARAPLVHLAAHLERRRGIVRVTSLIWGIGVSMWGHIVDSFARFPIVRRHLERLRHAARLRSPDPSPITISPRSAHARALLPVVDHAARVNRPAVGARVGRAGERPERRHRQRRLPSAVGAERDLLIHDRHECVVAVGELVGSLAARRPLQQQQPAVPSGNSSGLRNEPKPSRRTDSAWSVSGVAAQRAAAGSGGSVSTRCAACAPRPSVAPVGVRAKAQRARRSASAPPSAPPSSSASTAAPISILGDSASRSSTAAPRRRPPPQTPRGDARRRSRRRRGRGHGRRGAAPARQHVEVGGRRAAAQSGGAGRRRTPASATAHCAAASRTRRSFCCPASAMLVWYGEPT